MKWFYNLKVSIKFLLSLVMVVTMCSSVIAQEKQNNSPKFFGYVRSDYQADFAKNQSEFLIKQARFGVRGDVNEYAGYRVFVDFARLGKLQTSTVAIDGVTVLKSATANFSDVLLDAEAIITPVKDLSFSVGQFKVPFSTDNLRGGADIDFINRPLLTNVAPGLRDVGFMGSYKFNPGIPVELKTGLFNGAGQNKTENDKTTNYSFRAVVQPVEAIGLSANYYGGQSSSADLGIFDFGADIKLGNALLSGEYGQKNSKLSSTDIKSNAYFAYATYIFEFSECFVSQVMPAIRYENYDPNSDISDNEISRITTGVSLQFAKIRFAQFRVNYELFDYKDGTTNPNKLIIELQTRF